jgi:uracil phosphoribosyltransferase
MVIELGKENSLLSLFLSELRDVQIQKDSMRFRRNLERVGEVCAYEISKKLDWTKTEVNTPLGIAPSVKLNHQPVLATVLRAGLPFHQGLLNYFDRAENAFISAYRKHHKDNTFEVKLEYLGSPDLNGKTLILCDPMLASGHSLVAAYNSIIRQRGTPAHVHLVSVIGSQEGVNYVKKHLPDNITLWIVAIDEELTTRFYIVPGLGDAGDLAYGEKI